MNIPDPGASGLGAGLAAVAVAIWKIILPLLSQWATKKFLKSDPGPVAPKIPQDPAPIPSLPPIQKKYLQDLAKVAEVMGEWTLEEARKRVRALERDLQEVSADSARTAQRLVAANYEVERLNAATEQLRADLVQAQREARFAEQRAKKMADELREWKRQGQASHSTRDHIVTPIRPPKKV